MSGSLPSREVGLRQRQKSESRMKLALEAARVGTWEWEIGSNRTSWSPENYTLMGLAPGAGLATYDDWLARVHPEDRERAQAEVARAVEQRGDLDFEYRAVWPSGTVRWLRDIGKMMLDENGTPIGMYGIQVDVTDRRELEERLRRSERVEAMALVAATVAHDFNNVLTVIAGYGEQLREDPRLNEMLAPQVEEILAASRKAATLTHQLLALGRRQVLQPQALDLNRMITDMNDLLARTLGENIRIALRLAPELGCVWADPGQIEQVLLNLVVNAKHAMPHGGRLTLETFEIEGETSPGGGLPALGPGRYVAVSVEDTGQGMDASTLERIFDPFFTTRVADKGSGLGLASVLGIIEQSGGRIAVQSEAGRGTKFTFCLPRVEGREQRSRDDGWTGITAGNESILVVEDEPAIRELIRAALSSRGYSVQLAASAEEALDLIERRRIPIDVLVSDVVLTGLSGPALSARLAALRPGLRVVFITGYGHDALGDDVDPEIAEVVDKPFSMDELARKVRSVLDRAGPAR
jgi:PAS domain S-box-containing protein